MRRRPRIEGAAAVDIQPDVPHSARVWNYWLGGTDNFPADRAVGDQFAALYPDITAVARSSRGFLTRAVTFLAAERGIRQFLDIGTGLPTAAGTHQVAQAAAPDARVVYVDNDPLVLAQARALLTGTAEGATEYLDADLHDPGAIVELAGRRTLDLAEPVGLILMNILGHVPDLGEAATIVRRLLAALPSGSYLVTADGTNVLDGPAFSKAIAVWNANAPLAYRLRSPAELGTFLDGLEVVEPGLVPCAGWRPDPAASAADRRPVDEYGAVARKP
ncbi:SAM-dependent methyltransferase [Actinoplanes sp. NPDC049599]|uniref:SAM-dependent methyltransferase n=1 Tax=Actinoplanes sp. NPDC049599 TaxID=3363903 RepID=UPI0037B9594E